MKNVVVMVAISALFGSTVTAFAAGDIAAGKRKSATCVACHNADGNSINGDWPKLADQHSKYTVKQLKEFKSGERANAIMKGMATPLSEQDMEDLAAYFASQDITRGEADPELVERGRNLYRGGDLARGITACIGCHGPTGKGNSEAAFPWLAGQHAQYIATQLRAFRAMERYNDPGQMMRNIAIRMTDADIEAVASYIQGLR